MRYNVGDIVQLHGSRDHMYMIVNKFLDRNTEMYKISAIRNLNLQFNYICQWLDDDSNASRIQAAKK